jgi:hypothetical protein
MAARGCELRVQVLDNEERGLVLIAGGAPGYWGQGDATWQELVKQKSFGWRSNTSHLHPAVAMEMMIECMNMRLLSRVRDQLSLAYSCGISLTMLKGLNAGSFICSCYCRLDKLESVAVAALDVLRSPERMPFRDLEVEYAKKNMALRQARQQMNLGSLLEKIRPVPGCDDSSVLLEDRQRTLDLLSTDDVQCAWNALTGLDDPFAVLATSGPYSMGLSGGPVLERRWQPAPSMAEDVDAVAVKAAAAGLSLLD